jgi:hypothetical protein
LSERAAQVIAELSDRFGRTATLAEHLRIVDEPLVRRQIAWLRQRGNRELWALLQPVIKASWDRNYPQAAEHRRVARQVAQELEIEWQNRRRLAAGRAA